VVSRITDAAELGLAAPARSKVPDEGREVSEMSGRDLGGSREMLEAVRRGNPRCVTLEDLSDSSLLGAGEHDLGIVADRRHGGQRRRGRSSAMF
jgi:hypothetical protein